MKENAYSYHVLMQTDPMVLRALLRERVHHTVETRLYPAIYGGKLLKPGVEETARRILKVWQERKLPEEGADVMWAKQLLKLYDQFQAGQKPSFEGTRPEPLAESEQKVVEKLIINRRSFRQWTDKDVPGWMVDRLLLAGVWGPTACNVQPVRFVVLDTPEALAQLPSMEFSGEKVKIILCLDLRPYEVRVNIPKRNQYLDVGAAAQNILLLAQAMGLGAVWGTFVEREIDRVRKFFALPDYIELVTYVSLGYSSESVLAPGRMGLEDTVLHRTSR